ncbi:hypothetical protein E3P77_01105 [Wallemia ichthyophaga]|nr:hypothetical protein E3P77_01105 [Wallemia ichthyophaga]
MDNRSSIISVSFYLYVVDLLLKMPRKWYNPLYSLSQTIHMSETLHNELLLALSEQYNQSLISSYTPIDTCTATVEILEGVQVRVHITQFGYSLGGGGSSIGSDSSRSSNTNTTNQSEDLEGLLRGCSPAFNQRTTAILLDKLDKLAKVQHK